MRRVVCCLVVLLSNVSSGDAAESAKKPNILVIVADDLGYADVGYQGCKDFATPAIDALAKSGVRFTNGYVSGPYCSPTRAGLMTGRYQNRFGHEYNPGGKMAGPAGMPLTETTLPDRLSAAGYMTGMVGKWHLGAPAKYHPLKRGFKEFFGFLGGAHDYFNSKGVLRGTAESGEKEYLTDAFAREAVAFIDRHKSKPFFLYLAFNAVHTPMQADDARLKRFASIKDQRRRTYAAMTVAMDEAVGKVTQKLKDAGLEQDTLVIFISDNGGPTMQGTTINASINAPLRGSKRTTLEGGIRVPFIVSWPARLKANSVYHPPVIQLDAHVTALAAAGVEVKPDWKLDGVNLMPYLVGTKTGVPHEALYWRFGGQMAIRMGNWKLVRYDPNADGKKAKKNAATPPKLYNLAEDIGESKDLFREKPEKAKELQAKWNQWNATLVKPLWGPVITFKD